MNCVHMVSRRSCSICAPSGSPGTATPRIDPERCEHPYLNRIYRDEGELTPYFDCRDCGVEWRMGEWKLRQEATPSPDSGSAAQTTTEARLTHLTPEVAAALLAECDRVAALPDLEQIAADARAELAKGAVPTPDATNPLYYPLLFLIEAVEAHTKWIRE